MSILNAITVYVLVWWMVIFCVLPFNIETINNPKDGTMPGAPIHAGMKKKLILTTCIASVVWLIIYLIIKSDLISFHDIAGRMSM